MLAPIEKCTGCMACLNSCPIQCISITIDTEGFYQPVVDKQRCIECGKCSNACPVLQKSLKDSWNNPVVYAAWNKDEETLKQSSSGGIFGLFSKYIIENDGVVFGAIYNENLSVEHIKIESLHEVRRLHGSKYVQSNIGESFKEVKIALEENKYVLFTGTPCQVAGLYGFLGGDNFEKLFTCDLICHGVPSSGVFKDYISYLENRENEKLKSIQMRSKKSGWMQGSEISLVFGKCKKIIVNPPDKDPFMNGFMYSTFLRKSCYKCKYAKIPRESDITLGDFWGIGNDMSFDKPTSQGISLVIVNSKKGEKLFEKCKKEMVFERRNLNEAMKGNEMLSPHYYINPYRENFFKDYQIESFDKLIPKYLMRKQSYKNILIKTIVKMFGRDNIKKIKRLVGKE